jgi:two-component SAPR family response regulator
MRLDVTGIYCGIFEFDRLYECRNSPENGAKALELYRGPVLGDEFYDWISIWEAYYEMRYEELLYIMVNHCASVHRIAAERYYRKKLSMIACEL